MSRAARLGAFIVLGLAILVGGIFIIGGKQYMFSSTYRLSAQFATVVGLDSGAEVRVGGVHTGSVRSVDLPKKPTDKITVWMDLEKSTHNIIKQDSIATIETEGLLGNEYVAISFGSANGANVADGGSIASEPPLAMSDLLKKADGILDSSQDAIKNVTVATSHLSSISTKVDDGQGTVGALINDKKIYTELDQTTVGLRDTIIKAQAGVADFQENMEALKGNFLLRGFFKNRGYEDSSDLTKNQISSLPQAEALKTFTYDAQQLFEKVDTAKPKNQKSLRPAGEYLADTEFGLAVVVVSTSMEGDSDKDLTLTEARAAVVRDYLVNSFGFDDAQFKTFGVGKKVVSGTATGAETGTATPHDTGWGTVQIIVYPPGTEVPANTQSATATK
jgi:phospholipid/cholesterol/gamma-HCH transport system substrate-binding protein